MPEAGIRETVTSPGPKALSTVDCAAAAVEPSGITPDDVVPMVIDAPPGEKVSGKLQVVTPAPASGGWATATFQSTDEYWPVKVTLQVVVDWSQLQTIAGPVGVDAGVGVAVPTGVAVGVPVAVAVAVGMRSCTVLDPLLQAPLLQAFTETFTSVSLSNEIENEVFPLNDDTGSPPTDHVVVVNAPSMFVVQETVPCLGAGGVE